MRPTRHALLIGIDQYPLLDSRHQLAGCRNDVELMTALLRERFSFPTPRVLLDQDATRQGLLQAMLALLNRTRSGDLVVIYYSGHGSRVHRPSGEPPHYRETLVPYDSGRGSLPNRDILDLEIRSWLRCVTRKAAHVTLIFDCCHSGSMVRDGFAARARQIPGGTGLAVPDPGSWDLLSSTLEQAEDPLAQRYTLLAACHADQLAFELPGEAHGALTFFLARALEQGGFGLTYRDLHEQLMSSITKRFPNQHPQLEGNRDRLVFGLRDVPPRTFFAITQQRAQSVEIDTGRLHGWAPGTRFELYPPGTKTPKDSTPGLGIVELTSVHAVRSTAKFVRGYTPLPPAARAFLESHDYGDLCLTIELDPTLLKNSWADRLETLLRASPLLRCVTGQKRGAVRIQQVEARSSVRAGDPVPQFGTLEEPLMVVVADEGVPICPPQKYRPEPDLEQLRSNLVHYARYRNLLDLEAVPTPDRPMPRLDLRLFTQTSDGSWTEDLEIRDGSLVCFEGTRFGLEIHNASTTLWFLHVLNLGLTGRVSVLHPVPGVREALPPGNTLTLGMPPDEDRYEVQIPDSGPLDLSPGSDSSFRGFEFLKIFATPEPTDLSVFEQAPYRQQERWRPATDATPLEQLFRAAWFGLEHQRHIRCRPVEASWSRDRWLALTRHIEVRRR